MVVWPRTQELLRDWHALDALRSAGIWTTSIRAISARTELPLISVDFTTLSEVFDDPGALLIPQNRTESVLREVVRRSPLCELRTGVEVTGVRQDADSVEVTYAQPGSAQTIRGHYAVGCDGARGVVRGAVGMTLEGITYDSRIVLSDELLETEMPADGTIRVRFDMPGIRVAIRFAPRTWRVIASVGGDAGDDAAMSDASHEQRLRDLFGDAKSTTIWKSLFKIHRRHAQRFVVGRVALAGDAAHLNSPAGGQGMNAGIHDAANLAWKLAYALEGNGNATSLLASYDAERREMVTDTIERYTDRLTRAALGFSPRTKQFAIRAVSRAVRMQGLQCKIARGVGMLTGRYSHSPIVDARHPLAGRRIDDVRLPDGTRLNARRRGEAALVIAGDFDPGVRHIALPVPPKRWHVKPPVVLIVRPDGCVASVIEKPTLERIQSAWNKAFCGASFVGQPVGASRR
jgi:2-polyprenyl-6-methoxyphenol hydroxylase-like FAD-dependent oxidoreductase